MPNSFCKCAELKPIITLAGNSRTISIELKRTRRAIPPRCEGDKREVMEPIKWENDKGLYLGDGAGVQSKSKKLKYFCGFEGVLLLSYVFTCFFGMSLCHKINIYSVD